jgi:diguanylate cyclase (GGDEF)-like protein
MTAVPSHTRRPLGFGIKVIVFGVIAVTALVFVLGNAALQQVDAHYDDLAERDRVLERDASGLLTALLNQEVGMRGYLATGERAFLEPYGLGKHQEHEYKVSLQTRVATMVDPALTVALERLSVLLERWHHDVAEPQIRARGTAPLTDLAGKLRAGKDMFDQLRIEQARLLAAIEVDATGEAAARIAELAHVRLAMSLLAALIVVLAAAATLHHVRKITRPLIALVGRAERSEGFPAPSPRETIHEAYALAASLHQLDVQVARRERELEHAHDQALALTRFGEFVQQLASEDELHSGVERVCQALVAPSQLNILVRNASKNRLDLARSTIRHDPKLRLPILAEPMKCRAVRTLREVSANRDSPTACDCALGVPAHGSMLCVPMLAAGELIGVVNLQSAQRDAFTAPRAAQLQGYLRFAGGALSSLQLIAATRERALRDSLTGAHNRAFLAEYLPKTLAAATRHDSQVAVLMTDLDHFKRINDQYGHPAGDQAILAFTRCVQQQLRATDALVRYGGEEFAVLLTDVTRDGALSTAERIRSAVEELQLTIQGIGLGAIVRVSIGVAMFPDHGDDLQALIESADAALYTAKQQGRNRVVVADDRARARAVPAALPAGSAAPTAHAQRQR